MGGIISFYLNVQYPELFAASLFVGSQWDPAVLAPLAKKHFLYIISAADPKASKGMAELAEILQGENASFGEVEFSAKLAKLSKMPWLALCSRKGNQLTLSASPPTRWHPKQCKPGRGRAYILF